MRKSEMKLAVFWSKADWVASLTLTEPGYAINTPVSVNVIHGAWQMRTLSEIAPAARGVQTSMGHAWMEGLLAALVPEVPGACCAMLMLDARWDKVSVI